VATPFAVRRSGSLLLKALAVGGFAAAAWFVCGGVAAAGEDHSDEALTPLDAVNVALGEQQAATADLLPPEAVRQYTVPLTPVTAASQPFGSQAVEAVDFHPLVAVAAAHPLAAVPTPCSHAYPADPYPTWTYPDATALESDFGSYSGTDWNSGSGSASGSDSEEYSYSSGYGYSSGYSDGYGYSGGASNTMPAPLYEAKLAAKAAAREAAEVSVPSPASAAQVSTPARADVLMPTFPTFAATQLAPDSPSTPNAEVVWEVPQPSTPAPAPKQAPAPSSPTASSSSGADSGGGHRGGVIASFAGRSDSTPLTALSVERRDDGRSPGSVPGLPSTSPD
jgi:hypothetical protein